MKWYSKAAQQGDADAQFNLGVMYANGEGVTQNYGLCYVWESLAAAKGESPKARDFCASKLSTEALAKAQKTAEDYFNKY